MTRRIGSLLTLTLTLVVSLSAANGRADAPFHGGGRGECRGCLALVVTVDPDDATGHAATLAALSARGFETVDLLGPSLRALEAGIDDFLADPDLARAQAVTVWISAPIVADGARAAIGTSGSGTARSGGPAGLPVSGLVDGVAAAAAGSLTLVLHATGEAIDLGDVAPAVEARGERLLVALPAGGREAALALVGAPLPGDIDAAALAGALPQARVERLDADEEARLAGLTPEPDAGRDGGGLMSELLDPEAYRARWRADDWRTAREAGDIDAYQLFLREHCDGAAWAEECGLAQRALEDARGRLLAQVRLCHQLATDPDDDATSDPGIPAERLAARRAQAACIDALRAEPDDPRLMHQAARALERLSNPEFARYYEAAAERGYAVSRFRLAEALIQGRVPGPLDEAQRLGIRLMQEAAEGDFVPAQRLWGLILNNGFLDVRQDKPAARAMLERAARRDAAAAVDLATFIHRDLAGDDVQGRQDVVGRLRGAMRRGLREDERRRADELLAAIEAEIKDLQKDLAACDRRLAGFDPLDLYGLFSMDDIRSGGIPQMQQARQKRVLARMDLREIVEDCGEARRASKLTTSQMAAYGLVLLLVEQRLAEPVMSMNDLGAERRAAGDLIRSAALAGDPLAELVRGDVFVNKGRTPDQIMQGIEWLERAHAKGVGEATFWLALQHLNPPSQDMIRLGFRHDPNRGFELLRSLADDPAPIVRTILLNVLDNPSGYGVRPPWDAEALKQRLREFRSRGRDRRPRDPDALDRFQRREPSIVRTVRD